MFRWSEIMEENKEQLIEALEEAFKEAVGCRYMQYITEIYKDGTIRTWSCSAGSNSFSHDSFIGKSHEVKRFCFSNMDIEITEEDFRRHMSINEQNEAEMLAEENGDTFIGYIFSSGRYGDLIEECENEYLEWYKDLSFRRIIPLRQICYVLLSTTFKKWPKYKESCSFLM